jgi:tetratricopeptide (TPR) repeat protein
MLKRNILLFLLAALLISVLFFLPRSVIRNPDRSIVSDTAAAHDPHVAAPEIGQRIRTLRTVWLQTPPGEKNAIFADSLSDLYRQSNQFDSAAWFAGQAAEYFKTTQSWKKAGEAYYRAYTFAVDESRQKALAARAQDYLGRVLEREPGNLEVKCWVAMTYLPTAPMQGVSLLREVLEADPANQTALFNLGMLSIQSRQYGRAIERLEELIRLNPGHIQGRLLLGIAYLNTGNKKGAREQFLFIKRTDPDPAVQATVDSYLKDLK